MITQIKDSEIENARHVLENFVVNPLNRESALESGIFCIANQSSMWERPARVIYALRETAHPGDRNARTKYTTTEVLSNPEAVNWIAKDAGWRFHHNNRFEDLIKRFKDRKDSYWQKIVNATYETRRKYVDGKEEIKYIGMKTFSFWHLCMGGTNLLPIDVHIARQLADQFNFPIPSDVFNSVRRSPRFVKKTNEVQLGLMGEKFEIGKTTAQNVAKQLAPALYEKIEEQVEEYFSRDERLLKNGKLDMGLLAGVLWWRGANRGEEHQMQYITGGKGNSWILPYGNLREHNN